MIIFLYGPDSYRREERKRATIHKFRKKHSALGIEVFDMAEVESFAHLTEFLFAQSIFSPAKLAVLEHVFEVSFEKLPELVHSFLKEPATTLLLSEDKETPKEFSFLHENTKFNRQFYYLHGSQWETFVRIEAERRGLTFDDGVLQFFAALYQNDTWRLVTELEKISLLGKQNIIRDDLAIFDLELSLDFWELFQGLKSLDVWRRLAALERLLATNEPSAKLFTILSAQLKERAHEFAEYDLAVKSGRLEYDEAMVALVL